MLLSFLIVFLFFIISVWLSFIFISVLVILVLQPKYIYFIKLYFHIFDKVSCNICIHLHFNDQKHLLVFVLFLYSVWVFMYLQKSKIL